MLQARIRPHTGALLRARVFREQVGALRRPLRLRDVLSVCTSFTQCVLCQFQHLYSASRTKRAVRHVFCLTPPNCPV
jgi:hypothetical protein